MGRGGIMRILIAEDDFIARYVLNEMLAEYGQCDVVVDGAEAVKAFSMAASEKKPYDAIFLDIMMPNVDGIEALKRIRAIEKEHGVVPDQEVKVIMTTALDDPKTVISAYYRGGADSYLVKPITKNKIDEELNKANLV
jgi:two-component system, chemotaxis family, chemotaxis protein CheY